MSISKKIRFEVFKRDGFQCAYCGKTPPEVALEIDHIEPKSKGGKDEIENYITACFDCNRGKRNIPLDKIPNKINDNLEILKAKEEQLKEYKKYILKIRNRKKQDINKIENTFKIYFPQKCFTDIFKDSVKRFVENLDIYTNIDAMESACLKKDDPNDALKYYCGICWNKIKNRGHRYK